MLGWQSLTGEDMRLLQLSDLILGGGNSGPLPISLQKMDTKSNARTAYSYKVKTLAHTIQDLTVCCDRYIQLLASEAGPNRYRCRTVLDRAGRVQPSGSVYRQFIVALQGSKLTRWSEILSGGSCSQESGVSVSVRWILSRYDCRYTDRHIYIISW